MHFYAPRVCLVPVAVRERLNLLELELQTVVRHLRVLGLKPGSFRRIASTVNHRAISNPKILVWQCDYLNSFEL